MNKLSNNNFKTLKGEIEIPSDKSISHRAVIMASLAKGKSIIKNFSNGQDPHSTLNIFQQLGITIEQKAQNEIIINSTGKLTAPKKQLDCGNSGTTMRLLSGILARQNFNSILIGDESLSARPMKRVIEPLSLMGAKINSNKYKAPLEIFGQKLSPITYKSKIPSAQVKSCILLAGLGIEGVTTFTEPFLSRNHTEIMLKACGANIITSKNTVSIEKSELSPIEINVCGDISSAAYFMVAALIVPNSDIILRNVGLNPTRAGIIDIIKQMNGDITILNQKEVCGELVGDIQIKYSNLKACNISGEIIPRLIDELPVIAVLATQAEGQTTISDAQDLRNKESDRISTVVKELTKLGAEITETPDGMIINGKTPLTGDCTVETYHDHRLAMSLYVAGLICKKEILINGFEWVNISFPNFEELFEKLKN
jgi:3-phosphoshikimate 1-carboxyvinyltransferase